jgi:peptidoglycan/xylan/chitin deacetylase (PgdA/CDA1 family)
MKLCKPFFVAVAVLAAAACSGGSADGRGGSPISPTAEDRPAVMQAVDGIPGWERTGPPERFNKEALYGYIDGGAEIVLEFGFRDLAVFKFKPAQAPEGAKEVILEIYRMASGEAAFGLYSSKLEGDEKGWPGIEPDNSVGQGQANLVKAEYLVNILAPECTDREIGEFAAALEPKIPGGGTSKPAGMHWLPREGMVAGSGRYIKGPLAAQNESPFLDGAFWGFGGPDEGEGSDVSRKSEAFSAKYGAYPTISKLVVVKLGRGVAPGSLAEGVSGLFKEYLKDVRRDGGLIEGRNEAGRWFLFGRTDARAALILGEPDEAVARARIKSALARAAEAGDRAAATPRSKPFVVVTFDTEDYVTPEAEHIDDIPKWLAETMAEEGVTGTFFVIGEKARSLEKRGRRDVIAAMARHDIGSHTNFGSIHPTVTEELEKAGWDDGVKLMRDQESEGIGELERIFGVPVTTLARHGGSYGPQLVAALAGLKAGYQGSPASLPGHDVIWFCNALNFSAQYAGFDDAYYRDDLFEPVFDKLKAEFPERLKTAQVLALFAGHPTKIRAEEFWDLNFYNGKNTPPAEWRTPRLRPRESMITAQKNFRRMMRWLKGRDDIQITTYRALMDLYSCQKESMTRAELRAIAAGAIAARALAPSEEFSPAEAFSGLARAIAAYGQNGSLPRNLPTIHALGPMEMPSAEPEIKRVKLDDVYELARAAADTVGRTGALPSALRVGNARIGTGSLFAVFSAVFLDMDSGKPRPEYDIPSFEPYPRTNEAKIIGEVEGYKTWPVHKPDLDVSRIVEFTKLQLWTLKPARPCPR